MNKKLAESMQRAKQRVEDLRKADSLVFSAVQRPAY